MHNNYGKPIKCKYINCFAMFQRTTQKKEKQYCSRRCSNLDKKGKISSESWLENVRFANSKRDKQFYSNMGKKSSLLRTSEQYREIGKNISKAKKGKLNFKLRGEKHPNWKGGVSQTNRTERNLFMGTLEYKNWRRGVFERDNYTCVHCGIRSVKGLKVVLHADHIKPYSTYPDKRLDVNNGQTLCEPCHKETPTWGGRKWELSI